MCCIYAECFRLITVVSSRILRILSCLNFKYGHKVKHNIYKLIGKIIIHHYFMHNDE